jgi:hypothetical protein
MYLGIVLFNIGAITSRIDQAPKAMRPIVCPLLFSLLALPAPLLYVSGKWLNCRRSQFFQRLVFWPIRDHEMPSATLRYFERYTGELELLGFRRVCDYRLKRTRPFFCRLFVNDDPAAPAYGELSTQKAFWWSTTMRSCAFVTMFESGDYLETADLAMTPYDKGHMHMRAVPGASVADVYKAHVEAIRGLAERNQTEPVACSADEFPMIATYGQRLMYDRLVDEGIAPRNIYVDPAPPTPSTLAKV